MVKASLVGLLVGSVVACGGVVSSSGASGAPSEANSSSSGGGSSNGDPAPPHLPTGSSGGSSSGGITNTLATLDDACDGNLALTGKAILARVAAIYTPTFLPMKAATGTPAKLTIRYDGGAITCHQAESGNTGGAPSRPAELELAVRISLSTEDGQLNEVMDGTLTGQSSGYLGYNGSLPAASKVGSIALAAMPGFDVSISVGGDIDDTKQTAQGTVMQQGKKAPVNGVGMGQVQGLGTLK